MSTLPRKLRRRHAASRPAPTTGLPSFGSPAGARPEAIVRFALDVADRVGALLGRETAVARHVGSIEIDRPADGSLSYAFGPNDVETWHGDVFGADSEFVESIDTGLSADPDVYMRLGVETMARGIAAAVKRFERERLGSSDRRLGTDSAGNDVYESDVEDIGQFRAASAEAADDERSAREAWEAKYGPEKPRPIRDARDLLISIGDHLAGLGLEPDLGGDTLTFTFLGAMHRLELENLELRRPGPTADEMAIRAAGLPVG